MNEPQSIRPSKKQRELLSYIESFIEEHGYSPSYREIMAGCNYTSVATVSLHVNSLIKRGHLRKRDRSARSLEVVTDKEQPVRTNQVKPAEEKWLVEKVEHYFKEAEQAGGNSSATIENLQTLLNALRVLGLDSAAHSYTERLSNIRQNKLETGAIEGNTAL